MRIANTRAQESCRPVYLFLSLKPDVEKVHAITQPPLPQNKEELQRFLGMVNYFSQFIPNQ